uniref:Putative LOV domain-containing protein n=1 Tax=Polypodium amorphum TaxID=38355 RepID=A0A126X459_9MONI|nr:putative LOV domain-containing protein [Polypodium amorphum]
MGRRICEPSPVPAPSSSQSLTESQESFSSSTAQASNSQALIDSMSRSYDPSIQQFLKKLSHHSFLITDPHLRGHPIVYASDAFLHMSGYPLEEVLGRNPKFLQGLDTDRKPVFQLRDSVCEQKPCQVTLLNYTKQGWPFQIVLHMAPVFSQHDGRLLHFVGVQRPLYDCSLGLLKHTVQSAPTLLGLQRGSCARPGQEGLSNIKNVGCFSYLPRVDAHWQTGIFTGSQKKKMKLASTVLQLLIYELTKSSELKIAGALHGGLLCENAETALCSSLTLALTRIQQSFVILNPNMPGMPVLYASDKFLHSTGFSKDEVIGQNCRFLQGQDTDAGVVEEMRNCIIAEKACTLRFNNYRKDGSSFWNLWHVAPIRDHTAKVVYFVGVPWEVGSSDCCQTNDIAPVKQQFAAVGAVKVAVRSLRGQGLRRSFGP